MKRFMAFWGEGYTHKASDPAIVETVSLGFFTEKNGYDNEMRYAVENLGIAEHYDFSDMSGQHIIIRIA